MTSVTDCLPKDRLAPVLKLLENLPPLSPMVRHLLATLSAPGENTSLSQIAIWIEKDALTAGKVLALANSAYYGRREPILSIRHAVARLGVDTIRNFVLSMSMSGYWNRVPMPAEWCASRFNAHSVATAVLSEMIASAVSPENLETAFLAGLFHDIGHVAIAVLLRDDPEALNRLTVEDGADLEQLELELVGLSHPELSAKIVRSWNMPASIENAVRLHETPIAFDRTSSTGVELHEILYAAGRYVDYHGISMSGVRKQQQDPLCVLGQLGLGINDSSTFERFHSELEILLSVL